MKGKCNPLKMTFGSRNISGQFIEHNKRLPTTPLSIWWTSFIQLEKNARYNG
jgi:hypothetical protein